MRNRLVIVIVTVLSLALVLGLPLLAIQWRADGLAAQHLDRVRDALALARHEVQPRASLASRPEVAGLPTGPIGRASVLPGGPGGPDPDGFDRLEQRLVAIEQDVLGGMHLTFLSLLVISVGAVVIVAGLLHVLDRRRMWRATRRVHQLAHEGLRSHESERLRVARELHDGACQVLVSTRWLLERALLPSVARVEPAAPAIGEALERLDLALREVRHVSNDLYPPRLDSLGLAAALEAMVSDADGQNGTRVRFSSNVGQLAFDLPISAILFRIAQEALSNALRHARAGTIVVTFTASRRRVSLSVVDDGQGFDLSALARSTGTGESGLRRMRDRMQALGGRFRLRTDTGRGTRVSVALPTHVAVRRSTQPSG